VGETYLFINERDFITSVKYSEKFKVIANPEKHGRSCSKLIIQLEDGSQAKVEVN
jgi:hypothetical protein